MAEVKWTDEALDNLNEIAEYISKGSIRYAEITAAKLFSRTDILEQHPLIGRVVPEFSDKTIRQLIEGNYRIIYRVISEAEIHVIAVHHAKRRLTRRTIRRT